MRGWQEIDGVDVMLIIIYVAEFDEMAGVNANTVYLSYLDTAPYYRPGRDRGAMNRMVLILYYDYVRRW
jgi:hypothetical protein